MQASACLGAGRGAGSRDRLPRMTLRFCECVRHGRPGRPCLDFYRRAATGFLNEPGMGPGTPVHCGTPDPAHGTRQQLFQGFQVAVDRFIAFANAGNQLVFGPLARPDAMGQAFGAGNEVLLAITITGTIILVAPLGSLLYHYGVLQWVVKLMAW